jgi:eukaryotic-like serine/threonine-protein kinase
MDSARWEKVQSLFHETADLPESERLSSLRAACDGDEALVSEVLALLEAEGRGASLLDRNVAHVAHQLFSDTDDSRPFKQFGPYRILKTLGEGGMGTVYLAHREDLGSLVAVKILRDAWLSPARRKRFASEQRTLAQLNHPFIARLYDADTSPDGTPFFVMEYVEGVPLTDYCRERHSSVTERLRLFRAVCEAVLYAHQHAVIHRDLKPSNILVKNDGAIRLLDFGIAKHAATLDESADQTLTGLPLMTPAYAAPEQMRGDPVGVQTDVYSLGVILYELLTGRLPFDLSSRTPAQVEQILAEAEPAKPSKIARTTAALPSQNASAMSKLAWADLDVLCLTAMHKDLGRRYQSVEALARDVDHYLKGEPLEARPDTAGYRVRKFITRNRQAVMAVAVMLIAAVGLVVFFTVRLALARNAALAEASRRQRIQTFMTNLFQGGDASAGPADNLRVVTLLDRGVQQAHSLSAEPEVQADLYETLGTLYQNLGKFDQANDLLHAALVQRQSIFGLDSAQVAESLVDLGLLRNDQAQLPEAERLVRQGLAMSQRHLPPNNLAIVKATTALGTVLDDRGSYDAAISVLEQAMRMQSSTGAPTSDYLSTAYELANAHFYAGHYDKAETMNQQLLFVYRQTYGERHPRVADILVNLAEIRQALGHYPDAEEYSRQALGIAQSWYGKDSPQAAIDLTIVARTLVYQKRYREAEALLNQSLAIKERVYGEVHPSVASSLNELGNVAYLEDKDDLAAQYFTRMGDIYRAIYGEHHYLYATALSNLGSVYLDQKQWTRAETIFRQVIQLYTETQPDNHINIAIAQDKLGRALLRQRRYAEAEVQTRAAYDTLIKQTNPATSWLVSARKDLIEEYAALKQPAQAARFRAELAAIQTAPPQVSARK